ncbi:hypothetical protein Celaphus_00001063 [Cervus elaphus hippelaphus]|uniref:Uncharacterized protein n=1 Tax=Cervus elaphus hippelaphus TaxID=46360 RepID=A0A212D7K4_CEREH|nr:hypothetical protein Celaphus_00001063 [Cervus elaphus hippelaphus]
MESDLDLNRPPPTPCSSPRTPHPHSGGLIAESSHCPLLHCTAPPPKSPLQVTRSRVKDDVDRGAENPHGETEFTTPLRVWPLVSNEITGGTAGSSGAKPWDCCSSACLPENSWAVFVEGIYGQQGMPTTPLGSGGRPAPYSMRDALTRDCGALRGGPETPRQVQMGPECREPRPEARGAVPQGLPAGAAQRERWETFQKRQRLSFEGAAKLLLDT